MDTNEIFKYRSVTACMKASYELVTSHLVQILKKTWWASLIFAIFAAITLYFRMPNKALHDWGLENPWGSYLIQTFIYLAFIISSFLPSIALWNWLNGKGWKRNVPRFVGITILLEVVMVVFLYFGPSFIQGLVYGYADKAIPAHQSMTFIYCVAGVLGIINFILIFVSIMPFAYMVPRHMMREKGEAWMLWKSFKCGLRHFGSIFKMGFLGFLILLILCCLLSLPCMLLSGAQVASQLGALGGDPLGVPAYFTILYLVVLIITWFIYVYIYAWQGFAFVFLYGTIETQEKEKRERLQTENQEQDVVLTSK